MPPWERYQQPAQGAPGAPAAPINSGRDPADVRAAEASARGDRNTSVTEARFTYDVGRDQQEDAEKAAEAAALEQSQANGVIEQTAQIRNVIEAARQAKGLSDNWFATGFGANAATNIGGSSASDVQALLNTIGSNTAFDRLQRMREESPTGGALGAVTETELAMLRDSIASIGQSQSDEQFQRNMDTVIASYQRVLDRLEPQGAQAAGAQTDREAPATASGTPPRPTGGEGGPGGGARAPSQQDIYANGVEFGMDTMGQQEASFDRNAYLQNELGLGSGQEDLLTGFARANSGNRAITAEDVRRFYQANNLPQPTDADLATFVEDMRSSAPGTTWGGIDTTAPEQAYQATLDAAIAQRGENPESQGFAANRGVGQGLQFNLGDEIAGGLNAIGSNNPGMAYLTERDMQRRMDERASESSPWTYGGGQVIGGMITGGSYARGPMSVGNAARIGAVEGAVAGFGSGEGLGGSLGGAAIGAGGGALLGGGITYAAPKVGNALTNLRGTNRNAANALASRPGIEAAQRMEVPVRGADINPAMRPKRAELLQGSNAQQIRDADTEDLAAMEGAIQRELGASGAEPDRYGLGDTVQGAVRSVREKARNKASLQYTAANRLSRDVRATPTQTLQAIDGQIDELARNGENQNSEAIAFLRGVREDLARDGGLGIEALRSQRTSLASTLKTKGLDATDMERRMGIVHDALAADLTQALRNTPEALARFRSADQLWRSQAEFGERIVRQLTGTRNAPVAAADAARRVESFFQKDFARARRLMAELDEGQRAQITEHLADSLGRNRNGQFSMADFLRHTSRGKGALMDERSMRLAFGERGMAAIQDLRAIATMKQAAQSQTNRSNTGGVVAAGQRNMRTLILSALGFTGGGPAGAIAAPMTVNAISALGEQRAVRLLLNPDVTRWLRQIPATTSPKAINGAFARLRSVANRTPGMAADVQALERWIVGVANDNGAMTGNVAAQPQEQQQGQHGQPSAGTP